MLHNANRTFRHTLKSFPQIKTSAARRRLTGRPIGTDNGGLLPRRPGLRLPFHFARGESTREEKMPSLGRNLARAWTRAGLVIAFTLVLISSLASSWAKPRYKTLHTFKQTGPNTPTAALVADLQGNLYGTTLLGGVHNAGSVFKLAPDDHHGWTETVLHTFNPMDGDGEAPADTLIFDAAGNLYGTTQLGGAFGRGTVFELAPDGHGGWNETVLHSFDITDGEAPWPAVIFDAAGNVYGTTQQGGAFRRGTVFELAPDGHGGWNETVLHSFYRTNGEYPEAGLISDSAGNLYGTTPYGGGHGGGTVFELAPDGHGGWKQTVLHSFNRTDGAYPAGLIFDAAGNLYGTTSGGAAHNAGTVFELAPDGHGGWKETVLHSFNGKDQANPRAGLIFDAAGNLYATTSGGAAHNAGTVFELAPNGHGGWKETVLHSFKDRPGADPLGSLIFGPLGHLYGTTSGDIQTTWGSVFEITP